MDFHFLTNLYTGSMYKRCYEVKGLNMVLPEMTGKWRENSR